ncbi:pyrroline-5-carboxylate reductase [Streptococcus oricebi]|uniref:Pyrroline-5-carboxylate reductase n=1 Tax=Streptococcus oricebi TaxID=1547447 RepID=A0ABS5B2U2_9STRE|nr:pyrroline-5-carboxylate reductase [Streptococcus oricebi]MBP2623153.1 pyrroline-5-carboxylate reductase [Streptococcus oricebi]
MKIAFIGLGNMGSLLARLVLEKKADQDEILLANRSPQKAEQLVQEFGGRLVSNQEVFNQADMIFLGLKPKQVLDLLEEHKEELEQAPSLILVSMAAGVRLSDLAAVAGQQHRYIRIMPNTPITVGAGVISYSLSEKVVEGDRLLLEDLLERAGQLIQLEEKDLDAATALAGCGPAFVYTFIETMADAGVRLGLPRHLALSLASQTVLGAAQMTKETGLHPALLKDQVTSPAGATIEGLVSLEETGFRASLIKALEASYQKAQDLGR